MNDRSPHEILYVEAQKLSVMKTFGWLCYTSNVNPKKIKFDLRDNKTTFLGFKQGMKGYIALDIQTKSIPVSRNVQFYELEFPF